MISLESLLWLVGIAALLFLVSSLARVLREYERAVIFRLGRSARAIFNLGGQGNGPGVVFLLPLHRPHGQGESPDGRPRRAAAGRHHPRQRLHQGERGDLLPRGRSRARGDRGPGLSLRHVPDLADHAAQRAAARSSWTTFSPRATRSTSSSSGSSTSTPSPGASRWPTVEVKQIDLPQDMQRAMAKQAEAERERRAKVINADGEFQAAAKLVGGGRGSDPFPGGHPACASCRRCARSPRSGARRRSSRSPSNCSGRCSTLMNAGSARRRAQPRRREGEPRPIVRRRRAWVDYGRSP